MQILITLINATNMMMIENVRYINKITIFNTLELPLTTMKHNVLCYR